MPKYAVKGDAFRSSSSKYIDGIPQGKEEDIDLFYYWEDFLGYPSPEEVNNKLNKK